MTVRRIQNKTVFSPVFVTSALQKCAGPSEMCWQGAKSKWRKKEEGGNNLARCIHLGEESVPFVTSQKG